MTKPKPTAAADATATALHPANRLGLDYTAEAAKFAVAAAGIIDVHTHINGPASAGIYRRAADLYGVRLVYSMTHLEQVEQVREVLGSAVRFIAVPNFTGDDRRHHHGPGYIERIEKFHALGARIVKFWAAPRGIDYGREVGDPNLLRLDAPHRLEAMRVAHDLGMIFMVHVADPDTWFAAKYADASLYGTKAQQYEPLEELLDRFSQPWIAAHMGGWPENLDFLSGLLQRHDNLYLDTSAAKWMLRELSRHTPEDLAAFLTRFNGRILFGSDILTSDEHLARGETQREVLARAGSPEEAFDLYASRYWALRSLFETDYHGPSPIADPDLAMTQPDRYSEMDAPVLAGKALADDLLRSLYHDAAHELLEPLHR
ncbi:MAG: amidohydrolase family protein [Planctomycetota bacterium]|nr:amidohydrolase family protein [Planctomycetota bacterium]